MTDVVTHQESPQQSRLSHCSSTQPQSLAHSPPAHGGEAAEINGCAGVVAAHGKVGGGPNVVHGSESGPAVPRSVPQLTIDVASCKQSCQCSVFNTLAVVQRQRYCGLTTHRFPKPGQQLACKAAWCSRSTPGLQCIPSGADHPQRFRKKLCNRTGNKQTATASSACCGNRTQGTSASASSSSPAAFTCRASTCSSLAV